MGRFLTIFYSVATELAVWCMTIMTFFQEIPFGVLPYKAWIPYDYSGYRAYWFTFYLQLFSVVLAANFNIGFDSVIPGFILQICAQFNLLKCKLHRAVNSFEGLSGKSAGSVEVYEDRLVECIRYHNAIFEYLSL